MSRRSAGVRTFRAAAPAVLVLSIVASGIFAIPSIALAQAAPAPTERFVLGPLTWTPTIQLREAGIDSNVFITPVDAKQDVTGSLVPSVSSQLTLGIAQFATTASAEYVYFQKYTSQRALNGRVASRMTFPLTRIQPLVTASWARVKERTSDEIDIRAPRTDRAFGTGLTTRVSTRLGLTAAIDRSYTLYDPGSVFRGVDLASDLNRQSTNITAGLRFAATPLTSFTLDAGVGRDEFTNTPNHDTDNIRGSLAFVFAPDAVISGHAQVGYHRMLPTHDSTAPDAAIGFSGLTSSVDISYTLLGITRVSPHYQRDTTYSASVTQPYYLSNVYGLDILQTLFGPLSLTARGSRDTMAYPATAIAAARTDHAETFGGGLTIRISTQGSVSLNYDNSKRRSTFGPEFGYERRRIYTTITYGF